MDEGDSLSTLTVGEIFVVDFATGFVLYLDVVVVVVVVVVADTFRIHTPDD